MESRVVMVVVGKKENPIETWMFSKTFTTKMWLLMIVMHMFIGFVIWLIEHEKNSDLKGFGTMIWFCVTVLIFAQSKFN